MGRSGIGRWRRFAIRRRQARPTTSTRLTRLRGQARRGRGDAHARAGSAGPRSSSRRRATFYRQPSWRVTRAEPRIAWRAAPSARHDGRSGRSQARRERSCIAGFRIGPTRVALLGAVRAEFGMPSGLSAKDNWPVALHPTCSPPSSRSGRTSLKCPSVGPRSRARRQRDGTANSDLQLRTSAVGRTRSRSCGGCEDGLLHMHGKPTTGGVSGVNVLDRFKNPHPRSTLHRAEPDSRSRSAWPPSLPPSCRPNLSKTISGLPPGK